MAVIISDAGPLIAFAKINQLHLLESLFSKLKIPEAVWQESQIKHTQDSVLIANAVESGWLNVTTVNIRHKFPASLGGGEIEAMSLALGMEQSLIILDDQLARRYASRLELNFVGTVKVLSIAEEKSLIPSAEDLVLQMIDNGYRISTKFLL